jgi:hypothetical protein
MESSEAAICESCDHLLGADSVFCPMCGTKRVTSNISEGPSTPSRRGAKKIIEGGKNRVFPCSSNKFPTVVDSVEEWLAQSGYNVQRLITENGDILLQVERQGSWRKLIANSIALNVLLSHNQDSLSVSIGSGRWLDKAAIGAVALVFALPIALAGLTATGVGTWKQYRLPDKIMAFIEGKCH